MSSTDFYRKGKFKFRIKRKGVRKYRDFMKWVGFQEVVGFRSRPSLISRETRFLTCCEGNRTSIDDCQLLCIFANLQIWIWKSNESGAPHLQEPNW